MEDLPKLSLFSGISPLCFATVSSDSFQVTLGHRLSADQHGLVTTWERNIKLGVGWGAKENGPDVRLPRLYVTVLDDLPRRPHENPLVPPAGWHRRQSHMPSRGIWVCSIKMVIALNC